MTPDLNTLINLGVLSVLAFLVRGVFSTREEVRAIKTTLGINGSGPGLVQEVTNLRIAKHEHANAITRLTAEVESLKP
jgi:hypothetical protein